MGWAFFMGSLRTLLRTRTNNRAMSFHQGFHCLFFLYFWNCPWGWRKTYPSLSPELTRIVHCGDRSQYQCSIILLSLFTFRSRNCFHSNYVSRSWSATHIVLYSQNSHFFSNSAWMPVSLVSWVQAADSPHIYERASKQAPKHRELGMF